MGIASHDLPIHPACPYNMLSRHLHCQHSEQVLEGSSHDSYELQVVCTETT